MNPSALRKVLCHSNQGSQLAREAGLALVADLRRAGLEVYEGADCYRAAAPDLLVLLGGDGFLMESIRLLEYPETPVFGVNFGTVGFLMNPRDCLPKLVPMIREGLFIEEPHPVLEARLELADGRLQSLFACNDFVLERMGRQSLRLEVAIDGVAFNRYAGDGLVISTAAGSTAYNLAARGPVVHPAVEAMLMTPLNPHRASPFRSVQFSLVLPLASRLRVAATNLPKRSMRIVADGNQVELVAAAEVTGSGRKLTLLRSLEHVFVKTLRRKFIGD